MMSNKYYNPKSILKTNADYNLIIGKRSNGKTYSICNLILQHYCKTGVPSAYIRRYQEELTSKNIADLFSPHDIVKISGGKYNHIRYYNKSFYLGAIDDNGNKIFEEDKPFCYCFALNVWERSKGADRGQIRYILFDEFMTRDLYLSDEFVKFINLMSSLIRDRDGTQIFMLANTVSKYCPYFAEMGISEITELNKGELKTYINDKTGLKLSVEYCRDSNNTTAVAKFFDFANTRLKMITSGDWEFKMYPHSPYKITDDMIIQKFYIIFDNKMACGKIVSNNGDLFLFFNFQTRDKKIMSYDIVYSTDVSPHYTHVQTISNAPTRAHEIIKRLIDTNKIYYADNEVGEFIRAWLGEQAHIISNRLD